MKKPKYNFGFFVTPSGFKPEIFPTRASGCSIQLSYASPCIKHCILVAAKDTLTGTNKQ